MDPHHADARHYLGMAICFTGDVTSGISHIRASLGLKPNDAIFHNNLALWELESGEFNRAEQNFLQALEINPDYRDARLGLARLLLQQNRNIAVRLTLEKYFSRHFTDIECGQLYAEALLRLGEITAAVQVYTDLLIHHPEQDLLLLGHAEILMSTGHVDQAQVVAMKLLTAHPQHVGAMQFLAHLEERRNRLQPAEEWAVAAINQAPESPALRILLARIQRRQNKFDRALAQLESINPQALSLVDQSHLYMERGTILDKLGRYDEAFLAFQNGNDAVRCQVEQESGLQCYDWNKTRDYFDSLVRFFNSERIKALSSQIPPGVSPAPLFIVGFPRSGTTLVEQMLSTHPHIHAGDELNALHLVESSAAAVLGSQQPFPDCLTAVLDPPHREALGAFRDQYLRLARESRAIDENCPWFTDKMPLNETRLGLIRLLFPQSPVVHVVRHPLDVVLSCFMNELTHGKLCALAVESAAQHYVAVMDLVTRQVDDLGLRYLRIRYEDLVDDPEGELRRVFSLIGEPWVARCLDFHLSGRVARTASYAQVSQPLYRTSQERWRHYRQHLAPAITILSPLIERLGYQVIEV